MAAGAGKRGSVAPKRYVTDTSTRYFYRGFYPKRYKHKNKRRKPLCRRCDSTRQDCKVSESLFRGTQWTVLWPSGVHAVRRLTNIFSKWNLFFFVFSYHGIIVYRDLHREIKRTLDSVRKDDPVTRLEVQIDQDVFDAVLVLAGKSSKDRKKTVHVYRIASTQTLNPDIYICMLRLWRKTNLNLPLFCLVACSLASH